MKMRSRLGMLGVWFLVGAGALVAAFPADIPEGPKVAEHAARARQAAEEQQKTAHAGGSGPNLIESGRIHFPMPFFPPAAVAKAPGSEIVFALNQNSSLFSFDLADGTLVEERELPLGEFVERGLLSFPGARHPWVVAFGRGLSNGHRLLQVFDATDPRRLVPQVALDSCGDWAEAIPGRNLVWTYGDQCSQLVDLETGEITPLPVNGSTRRATVGGPLESQVLARVETDGSSRDFLCVDRLEAGAPPRPMVRVPISFPVFHLTADRSGTVLVLNTMETVALFDPNSGEQLSAIGTIPQPFDSQLLDNGAIRVLLIAHWGRVDLYDLADPRKPAYVGALPLQLFAGNPQFPDRLQPQQVVAAGDRPWALLADRATQEVLAVDLRNASILARWPGGPAQPIALAVDTAPSRDLAVGVFSLRSTWMGVLEPGGLAHFDTLTLGPAFAFEHHNRFLRITPDSFHNVTAFDGRYVAGFDLKTQTVMVYDPVTGAVAANGPHFVPHGLPSSNNSALAARNGTIAVTHGGNLDIFEFDGRELKSRAWWSPFPGWPRDVAVLADGTTLVLTESRLYTLLPDGREGQLSLPLNALGIELHPGGHLALLSPEAPWGDPGFGPSMVDLSDPERPVLLWSGPAGTTTASFVRNGAAVDVARIVNWSELSIQLLDSATGNPLGGMTPGWPFYGYSGKSSAFGTGAGARSLHWTWTWLGWEQLVYDVSTDTPSLIDKAPETFHNPRYAPRADGSGWYELAKWYAPDPNQLRIGHPDASVSEWMVTDVEEWSPLRWGFLACSAGPSHLARDLVLLRDIGLNRPPLAEIAAPATLECAGPAGTPVTFDGRGSTDLDSSPGTQDDISSYVWTVDGEVTSGPEPRLATSLPRGHRSAALTVIDRLGASATAETKVSILDTLAPEVSLTLTPLLDGQIFRQAWVPHVDAVDRCEGPVRATLMLPLGPEFFANHPESHGAAQREILVFRTNQGLAVSLFGPCGGGMRIFWAEAQKRGGMLVLPDTPMTLVLRDRPAPADAPNLVARFKIGSNGTVTYAAYYTPGSDIGFLASADDLSGQHGTAATSLKQAKARLCRQLPANILCRP